MRFPPLLVAVIALGIGAAFFVMPNLRNVRVSAGYAAYLYDVPITGRGQFKGVLLGPSSTGLRWRMSSQNISVTPYTYSETFQKADAVLAKDKLPLVSNAHIVWRIRADEASVRKFMEEFGGWDVASDPDEIAKQAYEQFIREPFRTVTRSILSAYNGLSVNESLPAISEAIEAEVKHRLEGSPFDVMSVVMGNASPPEEVVAAISEKVASEQRLQQRDIESAIALKNVEIERRNGEAAGARLSAEATERARAIAALSAVITPAYVQYLQAENIRGAERVYVPMSAGGLPLVGTLPMSEKKSAP